MSEKKKIGRPSNKELKEARESRKVGRPRGDNHALQQFKDRLIRSPKSRKVFDSILDAAVTDGHPNQAAAWKLVADRLAPVSAFDRDFVKDGRSRIEINITGVGDVSVGNSAENKEEDVVEAEYTVVDGANKE